MDRAREACHLAVIAEEKSLVHNYKELMVDLLEALLLSQQVGHARAGC